MIQLKAGLKLILIGAVIATGVLGINSTTKAETTTQITFPIAELGNCASATACKTYCDVLEHIEACVNFGKAHGLVNQEQADAGLKLKSVRTGPGGCTDKNACMTYCADPVHVDECVKFAQDHNL